MRRTGIPLNQALALLRHGRGWRAFLEGLFQEAWPLIFPLARVAREWTGPRNAAVAVVGSYGKSTTAAAVRQVLGVEPPGSRERNSYSFLAWQLLMANGRQRATVLEVGIDGRGQMGSYARLIQPKMTVVTSIGTEHHRSLGTLERTRDEKAMMVRVLPTDGIAVLNGDDPNVRSMNQYAAGRSILFGFAESNEVRADTLKLEWPRGIRFRLRLGGRQFSIQSRLVGRLQVYSLLAASAVGLEFGVASEAIAARLEAFEPQQGRLQQVCLPSGAYLLRDEVKSSLETVESAIEALGEIPDQRRIVVLGDISEPPGSQGPIYREIGRRLAEVADRCFVNARAFQPYTAGARRVNGAEKFVKYRDVVEAADKVRAEVRAGDVILVKGRDSQKMERVSLALQGYAVKCRLRYCHLNAFGCSACPLL